MKTKLTDGIACSLKLPRGKSDMIAFDTRRPGLGVRVRVMAGDVVNRTWVVQLRVAGRSQRHDLGSVTATSTKRARELAEEIFAKVRQGINPAKEKRNANAKAAEIFELLARRLSQSRQKAVARAQLRERQTKSRNTLRVAESQANPRDRS